MNSKKIDLKELLKEKKKIALGGHVPPVALHRIGRGYIFI